MNLFKELVLSAPVSARLQFGHNLNVIIAGVDTSEHKVKGIPVKANTFITLQQVNPETRKVVAQTEFNYWNLDHASDYVQSNFLEQFASLVSIITALGKSDEEYESKVLAVTGGVEPEVMLKTKDGAKKLQDALQNTFYEMTKDSYGANCPLLKCKITSNKKGFLEVDKVVGWILPMDSEEKLPEVSNKEIRQRTEAQNAPKIAKPDILGEPKPEDTSSGAGLVEKAVTKSTFGGL